MKTLARTNQLSKIAIVLILILLVQIGLPIFTNITYAAKTTTSGLKYVIEDGKVYITGSTTKLGKKVTIPSTIDGKKVVAIRARAFKENKKITSVSIPDTVTTIATGAFKDCTKLSSVTIAGKNLKNINTQAFYGCSSLASFNMPDSVTNLKDKAFMNCTKLGSVKLSSGLTTIPEYCFYNCTALKNVTIPKGITTIQPYAFWGNKNLTTVTFEKDSKLISIGDHAFDACEKLNKMIVAGSNTAKDLKLPDTVTTIGTATFRETNFSTVIIPDKLRAIGSSLFLRCKNLKKVYYYGNYKLRIDAQAFRECTKLEKIYATLEEVNDLSFSDCKNLECLYITPSDFRLVGAGASTAFKGCSKLKVYSSKKMAGVVKAGAKENAVDTEAPKVKVEYSRNEFSPKAVTVTLRSADSHLLKPMTGWESGDGYKTLSKTYTDNTKVNVDVQDFVGNKTTAKVDVWHIDKTGPQIKISGTTGTKWRNTPAQVKVEANDKSGIKTLKVQKTGSTQEALIRGSMGTIELTQYGQYKVVAIDGAGNQRVSDTFWNYVDMDKPIIQNVRANSTGKIVANVTDRTSSVTTKLVGNGKTYTSTTPDEKGNLEFSVASSGTYTLKATDSAGNIATKEVTVTIPETEKPTEGNVEKEEEEPTDETEDKEPPTQDTIVDEDTVKDETSKGEEEDEDTKKEEITETGGDNQQIPVETNENCNVKYDENNKTVEITKYTGTQDTLTIPETLEKEGTQYTVTKIGEGAFKNTGVRKVEIPKTVKEIRANAFENCQYLERVIIKNENINIDDKAFVNPKEGMKIYSKQGSTAETFAKNHNIAYGIYIEEGDFEYIIVEETFPKINITSTEDSSLTTEEGEIADETTVDNVTTEEITETVAEVLRYNGNEEKLVIPSTVQNYKISVIGEDALKGNTKIKQIELLDNIRKIKTGAFENCTSLSGVIVRNKQVEIGTDAFKNTNPNIIFYCAYDSTGMDYAKIKNKKYILIHGAFMYELDEENKTANLLSARVGEGDPEYVTIDEIVGDYTLGSIKAGAFLNTKLKGVIVKNKTVPIENVQLEPGSLEGVEVGTLYCYKGSTTDEYLKANSHLGIKVAYLGEEGDVKPEEVKPEEEELNIKVGEKESIFAKIYPTITTNKELNYKSEDEKIATVDENGNVTGLAEGETTIEVSAKADNSKVATVKIKVEYIKLTLKLNGGELNLNGKNYKDEVEIEIPYGYEIKDISKPTKYGYEFKGWYEEIEEEGIVEKSDLENPEEETIRQDITLGAKWEEIKPQTNTNGDNTTANKILPNTGKTTIMMGIIATLGTAIGLKIKIRKIERKEIKR